MPIRSYGCSRITIDADKVSFPCSQAWVDDARGRVWWDVSYLHNGFRQRGLCASKRIHWFRNIAQRISKRFGIAAFQGLVDAAKQKDYTLSSLELISFYAVAMDTSSSETAKVCEAYLIRNIDLAMSVVVMTGISCNGVTLCIQQGGIVPNFASFLEQYFGPCMFAVVESSWSEQARRDFAFRPLGNQGHHLAQCVVFLLTFFVERRAFQRRPLSTSNAAAVDNLVLDILKLLAINLDKYVIGPYCFANDVARPPPAVRNATAKTRTYVKMSKEAIWSAIEQARISATSLCQVLKIKANDEIAGSSSTNGDGWVNKLNNMYRKRSQVIAGATPCHYNVVADPARHSKRDWMVAAIYTWETDSMVFADVQKLVPLAAFLDSEVEYADAHTEQLVLEGRAERIASFRQLQAVSNLIRSITNDRLLTLSAFNVPAGMMVRAVNENESYVVEATASGGNRAVHLDETANTCEPALPEGFVGDVNTLILNYDEGSIGTSGIAFAEDYMNNCVHVKLDKLHRCVRDVKMSLQHASGGIFMKCQIYTTYIFGLNLRPFGSGSFGDQKKRLIKIFKALNTPDGELFMKHGHLIAHDLSMPFETAAERLAVWNELDQLPSFARALEHPKLSRWFSWNGACKQQLKEFNTLRMVFEYHLVDATHPDSDDAVPFEAVRGAAKLSGKEVQRQLSILKGSAGGFALCYSMLSTALLELAKVLYVCTQEVWSWYTDQVENV